MHETQRIIYARKEYRALKLEIKELERVMAAHVRRNDYMDYEQQLDEYHEMRQWLKHFHKEKLAIDKEFGAMCRYLDNEKKFKKDQDLVNRFYY